MEPLKPIMAHGADNFRLAAVGTVRGRRSPMVILAAERPSGVSKKSADPMTRKRSRTAGAYSNRMMQSHLRRGFRPRGDRLSGGWGLDHLAHRRPRRAQQTGSSGASPAVSVGIR